MMLGSNLTQNYDFGNNFGLKIRFLTQIWLKNMILESFFAQEYDLEDDFGLGPIFLHKAPAQGPAQGTLCRR